MKAERKLGRVPGEQPHTNPGYDVLSTDPATGVCYFIEVRGHLLQDRADQRQSPLGRKSHNDPEPWRLAVVLVPEDPHGEPNVHYLVESFKGVSLHPAQTSIPMNMAELLIYAGSPR